MVAVMRKAPYVNQLTERWCENLRTAVRAVTDDDRLTRATARDISGLSGPLSYWGDNLEKYLEATGQESVAAEKFFSAAFGYAARRFSRIARSDNRVSIDSHADAPADLRARPPGRARRNQPGQVVQDDVVQVVHISADHLDDNVPGQHDEGLLPGP